MYARRLSLFVVAGALLLSACHSMRFEVGDGPTGKIVHDRKAFYIAGLVSTHHVDVAQFCPNGAVAISEETTFLDGLFSALTLSIYTPRSSYYHCAADGQ